MKHKKAPLPDLETIIPILIGAWRRLHKLAGPADVLQTREFRSVVSAVTALNQRFANGKSLIGQNYFSDPHLLGAYLLYQWIVHYQEGLSLIGELPHPPKRVLDIASGPAPFAFAALRHGAHEVIATDRSHEALSLGAEVCGRYGLPLTIRQWNCLGQSMPVEGKFDLIILGHSLDELFPGSKKTWEEEQLTFVRKLLDRLNPEGHLLLVESSFSESNKRVLQLRERLVNKEIPIQAPCIWRGECPALKTPNSPCYAQREFVKPYLISEIQRAGSINLSSLKMSYLLVRHPSSGWPTLKNDKHYYRVVSPPVESFQGKRFYLCGSDGKKQLGSHLTKHPPESRAFEYLRRGELISLSNALEKQQALDIIQGTSITIEAACGKPIPEELNP